MAVLEILTYPDERLRRISRPVEQFDAALQAHLRALEETRRAGPGRRKAVSHGHLILVNPEITEWDGFAMGREGCLSVPDYTGNVVRAERIHVKAQDPDGNPVSFDMEGFEARAVQHELDHLDGLLFLDRLVSRRQDLFRRKVYE
jgi:peptide deformylase